MRRILITALTCSILSQPVFCEEVDKKLQPSEVAGLYASGAAALEAGKASEAIKAFTAVISSKHHLEGLREEARLGRAQALLTEEAVDAAKADLKEVIHNGTDRFRRQLARKEFLAAGGEAGEFLPAKSPRHSLSGFLDAVRGDSMENAGKYVAGDLKGMMKLSNLIMSVDRNRPLLAHLARTANTAAYLSEKIDEDYEGASLTVSYRGTYTFGMVPDDGVWKFNTVRRFESLRGGRIGIQSSAAGSGEAPVWADVTMRFQGLGLAFKSYAASNGGSFPATLEQLKPLLQPAGIITWKHPESGEELPLVYRAGERLANGDTRLVAAMSDSYEDKRAVIYCSGRVATLTTAEFRETALKQKWLLDDLVDLDEIKETTRKEVKTLVATLEEGDFKERAGARARLEELGILALPMLKEYRDHSNFETRMTIREIIGR